MPYMNDTQIHEHIEDLVAEEHRLLEHGDGGDIDARRPQRASKTISVRLDQYWDLLRQRRAAATPAKIPTSPTCAAKKSSNTISSSPAACHPERRRGVSS